MKYTKRISRPGLVIALALGLSVAFGGVAVGAGLILDPEKQAIVDSATAVVGPVPPSARHYRDPLPDAGPATDVADVKSDVVADLQRDREIMRPTTVPPDLRNQLTEIYGLEVLDNVTTETSKAMQLAAQDPNFPVYEENRLTVTQWQGVQVASAETATAMFLGYESWRNAGSTTFDADPVLQYQLTLVKESGKWKLIDEAAFDPAERQAQDSAETPPDGLPREP